MVITLNCCAVSKVLTESSTGSSSSNKVRTMLSIRVETIDFDIQACVLRVKGRNVEENEYVKVCILSIFIVIFTTFCATHLRTIGRCQCFLIATTIVILYFCMLLYVLFLAFKSLSYFLLSFVFYFC